MFGNGSLGKGSTRYVTPLFPLKTSLEMFVMIKSLTRVYSVRYFTPIIGDSNVLAPLTPWRTGMAATGGPGDPIQKKESIPLKSAKRHVTRTITAFNGPGEAETKRSVFFHEISHTGGREIRNNKTANGSTTSLAG